MWGIHTVWLDQLLAAGHSGHGYYARRGRGTITQILMCGMERHLRSLLDANKPPSTLPPRPYPLCLCRSALKMWVDTLEERDRVEGHYQTNIFDMKSMLEDRIKRADDISKAYKHFKLEVARSAEHSKTCRPISDRLLSHLEQDGGCALS